MVDRTGHTRYRKRGLEPSAEQRACSGERAFTRSKKSPGDGDWGGGGGVCRRDASKLAVGLSPQ